MRRLFPVLLLALALVGCGEPAAPTQAPPTSAAAAPSPTAEPAEPTTTAAPAVAAEPFAATIKTFQFAPQPIEVSVGTPVTWTNTDAIDHSVTSGAPEMPDGVFDSGFFNQNETFAFTFAEPGEYQYFCARHPSMVGTVIVAP